MDNLIPFGPDLENEMHRLMPDHPAIRSVNELRTQFNHHVSGGATGAERERLPVHNTNGIQSVHRNIRREEGNRPSPARRKCNDDEDKDENRLEKVHERSGCGGRKMKK